MIPIDFPPNTEATAIKTLAVVIAKVPSTNPNECWTQMLVEKVYAIDFYRGNPC